MINFREKEREVESFPPPLVASWLCVLVTPFWFGHQIYRIGILGCVLSSLGPWCKGWVAA